MGGGEPDAACVDATDALVLAADVQHGQNLKRLDVLSRQCAATGAASGVALRREMVAARADMAGVLTMEG